MTIRNYPFIHSDVLGPNLDPRVPRQKVQVDPDGLGLRAEDDPSSPWRSNGLPATGLYGLAARLLGQTAPALHTTTFELGGRITLRVDYASGRWDASSFHLTPATPEDTWIFYESTRTRLPLRAADPIQRAIMKRLLDRGERETSFILHDPETDASPISVESDRVGLAARRLYCQLSGRGSGGGGGGEGDATPSTAGTESCQ